MNPNETRSSHPSSAQVETLVDYMERNPGLAKGFLRTKNARERSQRHWEELAVRLNSLGGTIKTYKQWTKYWSDKKSSIKKKVAARSAARRRTGGGVEDEVELTELEERVVALCGGESFSTGDAHLGIEPFPENNTPSAPPSQQRQREIQDAGTDNIDIHSPLPTDEPPAIEILDSEQIAQPYQRCSISRRLFATTSQRISQLPAQTVRDPHTYHPSLSPPTITLSHTPTPSPSRRGCTQVASPVVRRRTAEAASSLTTWSYELLTGWFISVAYTFILHY